MCIFEKIKGWLLPRLDAEERNRILRILSDYEDDLSRLEEQYVTFSDRQAFVAKWSPKVEEIKAVRIPKRDAAKEPVQAFLGAYKGIDSTFSGMNEKFIQRESNRCDALLSDIDGKSLDPQQRTAVICNEDRNLVLAGAGSGKTLTISGKVKYLCAEKGVDPEDILLISFTKKAAEEMTVRISEKLVTVQQG